MAKALQLKRLIALMAIAFICGIMVRAAAIKANEPDYVFCDTFQPQTEAFVETTE